MRQIRQLKQYSTSEIGTILESLRKSYDIVRVVDVEECRVIQIQPDGTIHHANTCFGIWNRKVRCANCSSYRACLTSTELDKVERLGDDKELIHSIPIYLELPNGEVESCVIECVKCIGRATKNKEPEDIYIHTHDVLTRLYTQEKMFREIRQRLIDRSADEHLLLMGNIRNFSLINRLFGVECGNRVLVGIADMLRDLFTDEEVYGRYRDDRFVIFMRREKYDEATLIGHIRQLASSLLESPIYAVQIKIGVYEITDPEVPVVNMMEHAEEAAMSIRNNRDSIIAWYHPDMMERRLRNHRIITGFQRALDDGEFQIYLQPQVRDDGLIRGAEALVRWIRPNSSMFLPGEFLEVLHHSELLSHLDVHVWEKAVQLLYKWKGTPLERLYVSVNVDPTDFYHIDVPKVLMELCGKYGVPTARLRVEITETALIEDVQRQNEMVERLHRAGFLVEIDDFGKGYSSLSLLKDIHADVLKIDMGFLQNTEYRQRSRVILNSVIGMANELNMGVITEGVETLEQAKSLTAMGCHNFQGFFYSRPVPVKDFEALALENVEMGFGTRRTPRQNHNEGANGISKQFF